MDIAKANPHQLELTVGNMGVGIMSLAVLSSPPRSNSTIDGGQIFFGTIDFRPHPPTLLPVFANFDREIDLMIGSLSFCIGSRGSFRLSYPIYSGLSAGKCAATAMSTSFVDEVYPWQSPCLGN
jgi:hypothetical protein